MQRTLNLEGTIVYCYDDGSVEWLTKTKNQHNAQGNRLFRSYGWIDNRGYRRVVINRKRYQIHRLIALAFCENPENKPQVDHINRQRSDNRACNLRWATPEEQQDNTQRTINSKIKYGIRHKDNPVLYAYSYKKYQNRIKGARKMTFAQALNLVLTGKHKIACATWNGKNQWVAAKYPDENTMMECPYLYLHNARGKLIPYVPSQDDIFNDFWFEVKEETDQLSLNL